jgi:hypothetical protein
LIVPLNPLLARTAFNISQTRAICDAFDDAWATLRRTGSELAVAAKSHASRTILAERIIEMAQKGELDSTVLRNDALEHLHKNPPTGLIDTAKSD